MLMRKREREEIRRLRKAQDNGLECGDKVFDKNLKKYIYKLTSTFNPTPHTNTRKIYLAHLKKIGAEWTIAKLHLSNGNMYEYPDF